MKMKYSQFLWGILSLIILSNCCCISLAQQVEEEEEAEYYDGEYDDEYEEYDYQGCSKNFSRVWKHVISLSKPVFVYTNTFLKKLDNK